MRNSSASPVEPEISVVLPCYRSAGLARLSADRLADFLGGAFASYEVLVVDDGGGDFDAACARPGLEMVSVSSALVVCS